jgi:hypothetical protein
MLKIKSHAVGIDKGTFTLFSDFETGGKMWTGTGPREVAKWIKFNDAFSSPPSVNLVISLWDVHQGHNMRMEYRAVEINEIGFKAIFKTWGDTKIARVQMSWQAIGEVADPEDLWILSD